MTAFTVKNIPLEIYDGIKKNALVHHRSINSEIIACLERALGSRRFDPETYLPRIEALQREVSLAPLTDELLRQAKEEDRP